MEENNGFKDQEAFSRQVNNKHDEAVNNANNNQVMQITNEHNYNVKKALQILEENNVDYDGKIFHNVSLQTKKFDRRTFLLIVAALAVLAVSAKLGIDIGKPESDFKKAKRSTKDIISSLIEQKQYFGENITLPAKIDEQNKEGFENLISDIMSFSQNDDNNKLSRDQAIFAINLCSTTTNLYETYYGESLADYTRKYFSTYADVKYASYENYMQTGKPVPNPKNSGELGRRGINYAEGINNLQENINNLDLTEGNGKAL